MKAFTIRTYRRSEDYLEERDMSNWVDRVQLLIYLVALLDATIIGLAIWFILMSLSVSFAMAAIVGAASFTVVFPSIVVIDVSISTFDTSNYYSATAQRISNTDNKLVAGIANLWRRFGSAITFTIFVRTFLYFIVFIVSFQSLKFIFTELLQDVNREALAELKVDKETDYSAQIENLQGKIAEIDDQLYKEAAGTGDSGLRGVGPAYNTLKNRKEILENRLRLLEAREDNIIDIDSLASLSNGELVQLFPNYNFIDPPKVSVPFSKHFFGEESVYFHELIAAILSLILFLSIIILKVTGGERINKIYYNAALQDLYKDYRSNNIHERHKKAIEDYSTKLNSNYTPSAESFYRWFIHQYPETEKELIMDTLEKLQEEKIEYLDKLIDTVKIENERRSHEYDDFTVEHNLNAESIDQISNKISEKMSLLSELSAGLESIEEALKTPTDKDVVVNLTISQRKQKEALDQVNEDINELKNKIYSLNNKNTSVAAKREVADRLRLVDTQLHESLIAIKNKLIMLFVRQKLTLADRDGGLKTYSEIVDVIIEFVDAIIERFGE